MRQLIIKTPARLHLGLLDLNGDLGRLYGSLGVAIDRPNVVLWAAREPMGTSEELLVDGPDAERVSAYARRFLACCPLSGQVHLRLETSLPAHVGLGSGTQLALAVGTALARLGDLPLPPRQVSQMVGRGAHSGIGIAAFESGGFVVDGGHTLRAATEPPPVLFQHPFPEAWRFVVAVPAANPGINGEVEQRVFRDMPPAPAGLADRICRLLVMQLLPALIEQDVTPFGRALTAIQQLVGDSFAEVQGGRFANTVSSDLIAHLLAHDAAGAGQSSWGPALYALAADAAEADRLAGLARALLAERSGGEVFVACGANTGALCHES
jgi:beta-ribofuranosylaminobenzene 5'-phosphate synthase